MVELCGARADNSNPVQVFLFFCFQLDEFIYYSAQYNCRLEKSGIFPSDLGIFPMGTGIKLDLCFCIIPTVGLYGKLGEVAATHKSNISCRRTPSSSIIANLFPLSAACRHTRRRTRHRKPLSHAAIRLRSSYRYCSCYRHPRMARRPHHRWRRSLATMPEDMAMLPSSICYSAEERPRMAPPLVADCRRGARRGGGSARRRPPGREAARARK